MGNIINLNSSSFDEILVDLLDYTMSRGDQALKNLAITSAGLTVMDLIAALGAYYHNDVMSARIEANPDTARERETIINMAHLLGYSVKRKSAPKFCLEVVNNSGDYIDIAKASIIGKFKNLSVSPLSDYKLPVGISKIYCALGDWRYHEFRPKAVGSFARYLLRVSNIENDLSFTSTDGLQTFQLIKLTSRRDGALTTPTEIPLVEYIEEMTTSTCFLRTHYDGVIIVFGDSIFGKLVEAGHIYRIEYLYTDGPLPNISVADIQSSLSLVDTRLTLTDVQILFSGSNEDSTEKIRTAMSGYNYSRRRMVTLEDHKNILLSYTGVVGANANRIDEDSGCCSVQLTPLFEGGKRLDEDTTETIEETTFVLDENSVRFSTGDSETNSFLLPTNDFIDSLATTAQVWVELEEDAGKKIPGGITSGRYYYVIVGSETENEEKYIKLATSKINAERGVPISLYKPVDGELGFSLKLSHFSNTLYTYPLHTNDLYFTGDLGSSDASSFLIDPLYHSVYSDLKFRGNGTPVLVEFSESVTSSFVNLYDDTVYYAIADNSESDRIQFAQSRALALANNRIAITTSNGNPPTEGEVVISMFKHSDLMLQDGMSISENILHLPQAQNDFLRDVFLQNYIINQGFASFRCRLIKDPASTTLISGITENRDYYVKMVATVVDDDDDDTDDTWFSFQFFKNINLDPAAIVPIGGTIIGNFNIFIHYPADTEVDYFMVSALNSTNFIPETKYSHGNTIHLGGNLPGFTDGAFPDISTGTLLYLWGDSSLILPDGIDKNSFYYAISLGDGYYRLSLSDIDVGYNESDGFVTIGDTSHKYGVLNIDYFNDHEVFDNMSVENTFYNPMDIEYNYIDVEGTSLVGTDDLPGGYPTGTKIKFHLDNDQDEYGNPYLYFLINDTFYYIIRMVGYPYIRIAETKSAALLGEHMVLESGLIPDGDTATISIYDCPEETALRAYLEQFRVAGQRIIFNDPVKNDLTGKITVVIETSASSKTVKQQIRDIFLAYQYQMGTTLYVGDITKKILDLTGVIRVYVEEPVEDISLGDNEFFEVNVEDLLSNITILTGPTAIFEQE